MLPDGYSFMPANLTPDYLTAERPFRDAQSRQERIAALRKHKGTEKLGVLPPIGQTFTDAWVPQVSRGANLSLLVAAKMDLSPAADELEAIRKLYCNRFKCIGVSALAGEGPDVLARCMFTALANFAEHLRFARLFRPGDEHGIMVERTHAVEDLDILEFYA